MGAADNCPRRGEGHPAGVPGERELQLGPEVLLRCFRYLSFACYLPILLCGRATMFQGLDLLERDNCVALN